MSKALFITATDTGAGKTIISCAIGLALQKKGIDVGYMKPFQCSGDDTDFVIRTLGIQDDKNLVNPYYAKEPLAPYIAFKVGEIRINLDKVFSAYHKLKKRHEFLIIEGAGGLLVPLRENYLVADLIRDLDVPIAIVSRAGLGTLNHTLLTQRYALDYGIKVKGVIINNYQGKTAGAKEIIKRTENRQKVIAEGDFLAEKTNPDVLREFLDVPILGIVPWLKNVKSKDGLRRLGEKAGKNIDLKTLLRTEKSATRKLIKQDKDFLWHPFTQMRDWFKDEPLIIEEANGCYLKDSQGKWYLDGVSSLWVNVHGHRKREIDSALIRQLNKVAHSTLLGLGNVPAIELAKKLVEIAPSGLRKVFYSDSGSSAVEIALKIAYQYWQHSGESAKTKFIHLENSYHGDTIGAVSVGGIDLFHKTYRSLLFESYSADSPYCYRCSKGKNYPGCNFECLDSLKEVLEKHHSSTAALIVEPLVQAAGGIIVWPEGIYRKMRELCHKHNVLLIADEVAVGFGRTGAMFASEWEGVSPDMLCLAKGITGGYLMPS
jgi:dethiobiotin synthase